MSRHGDAISRGLNFADTLYVYSERSMCCVDDKCDSGWAEEMPDGCPDLKTSKDPEGQTLFRLVAEAQATIEDFRSHQYLDPKKNFFSKSCIARSLSMWETKEQCQKLKLQVAHKNKHVASVTVAKNSGVLSRRHDGHHSWWRCRTYDVLANVTAVD